MKEGGNLGYVLLLRRGILRSRSLPVLFADGRSLVMGRFRDFVSATTDLSKYSAHAEDRQEELSWLRNALLLGAEAVGR